MHAAPSQLTLQRPSSANEFSIWLQRADTDTPFRNLLQRVATDMHCTETLDFCFATHTYQQHPTYERYTFICRTFCTRDGINLSQASRIRLLQYQDNPEGFNSLPKRAQMDLFREGIHQCHMMLSDAFARTVKREINLP
jgi:hypothetical protein